ncbi:hypothetical protein sos41_12580 [Alphaproteobacteria bacterium SO-S41]|nr:hypothetical protein sos41_12580 [Alphaproteobacteria bacterium SO-S41]
MSGAPLLPNEPSLADHALTLKAIEDALGREGKRFLAYTVSVARLAVEVDAGLRPRPVPQVSKVETVEAAMRKLGKAVRDK